jgi:hypothetical protein
LGLGLGVGLGVGLGLAAPPGPANRFFTQPTHPAAGPLSLFPMGLLDLHQQMLAGHASAGADPADPFGLGACDLAALDFHWLTQVT